MNLVSNAVKFTDRGAIEVRCVVGDEVVDISVRDTGIGVKKEDMGLLFQQFSRILNADRANVEGTGLGLYLSRKIVSLLGGEVWAESESGVGSVFAVWLPLRFEVEET